MFVFVKEDDFVLTRKQFVFNLIVGFYNMGFAFQRFFFILGRS